MRFPFFRNRDSVKNGILISIRRTGDGFHPGLFNHYKSSKDPDRYFRKYESQIILFAGAEHILQENGMDLKHLNSNKLQEQIADLISRKESLNTQYVSFKQEIKELELIHQNLSKYLKQDAPEIQRSSHNKLPSL